MRTTKDKKRNKRIGVTIEIIGMIVACVLLFAVISTAISYKVFSGVIKKQMETLIDNTCNIARDCVNGDFFDEYLETKGESEASQYALELMQKVCNEAEFNYIYIIRPDIENGKVLNSLSVHGEMYPDLETYEVGEITEISSEDYYEAYGQIMNGEKSNAFVYRLNMPYAQRNKDHITGLAPIRNSSGEIVGIMCAEATFAWYKEALRLYLIDLLKWLANVLVVSVVAGSLLVRFRVVIPFIKITKETDRFAKTNQLAEVSIADEIKRNNELGQLATSVDQMEHQITEYIDNITKMTSEQEKLKVELDIATKIQSASLPHDFPAFPERKEFELFASMNPAKEVGGDFYDFFLIDDDHLALVVADVSGKGVPGALFMMVSKIMIDNYSSVTIDPSSILEMVNNKICENNEAEMFVTVWLGILEISTGILRTANAGHENPVIMKKDEDFVLLKEKHGLVIGALEGVKFKNQEYKLEPGDTIFMYTDGVPEATNDKDELYGTERMIRALNTWKDEENLHKITDGVKKDVDIFVKDAPQFDDLTMLVFRYLGNN